MENIPALLSTVRCGLCKSLLSDLKKIKGINKATCRCGLKIRALLVCKHCNKHFLNFPYLIRKTNYCSLKCYWTKTNKKQLRICKICNQQFYIKAYLIRNGFGFYCSMKCWFSIFEKQRVLIKCKECGKERSVYRSVYVKHPKFCSKKCSDDSKRDSVIMVCKNCKKEFDLPRCQLNRGRGSFCTWECYKKYRGESSLELLVRKQLEGINEPFQQETRVGKFRADFYLPNRNLVIECDGEYWHLNQKIKLRDQRKDKLLAKLGYNILRLRGQEIIDNKFVLKNLLAAK